MGAFVAAFAGAVLLWWIYFDASPEMIESSSDPGRLGCSAYHFIHPVIVAEVIVTAAADQRVLADPTATTDAATAWLVIGGTALFSARHAAFKATGWQTVPWSRLAAIVALGLFGLFGVAIESISVLGLGAGTGAIIVLFAISDRVAFRHRLLRRANADSSVTIDCNA